jgi:hypothetical protein
MVPEIECDLLVIQIMWCKRKRMRFQLQIHPNVDTTVRNLSDPPDPGGPQRLDGG